MSAWKFSQAKKPRERNEEKEFTNCKITGIDLLVRPYVCRKVELTLQYKIVLVYIKLLSLPHTQHSSSP